MTALARCILLIGLLLLGSGVLAQQSVFEPRTFRSEVDETRYKALIEELRCLVCQNQNIADSNADLARDLRDRVHSMIDAGRSDTEIIDFMVERYGDFVLYRPPLKITTAVLWIGPFVLGVVALGYLFVHLRRAGQAPAQPSPRLSDAERNRVRALLETDDAAPTRSER